MLLLLLATVIMCQSTGQQLEYLCSSSSTNTSNFQVTLLLNIRYGPDCNQRNPRWPTLLLPPELLKWQAKLQTKIEFSLVDTCSDSDLAAKATAEMIPYSRTLVAISASKGNNSICTINKPPSINIGFITETLPTGYGTESRLLAQAEVPLILTSDDIINSQSSDQSSVIAVGDKLQTKLKMMSKLMVEMEWDFVTVVYSDDAIGRLSVELFQNISLKYYICIDKYVAASYTSSPADINTVGVVLLGSEGIGLHLLGQLTPSPRVWVTGHDISGLAINNGVKVYSVVGESGSQLVINSLVSFSKALEEAENRPDCSSAGSSGQCISTSEFRQSLIRKLKAQVNLNQSYSVDRDGVVQSPPASTDTAYRVYFHKENTAQVAVISANGEVFPTEGFNPEPSLCLGAKCRVECRKFNRDQYTYIHGKWVIVLFLPIHEKASRWSCTEFCKTKLFRTEVAVYTLKYLKRKLDDNRFGLLMIDTCGYKLKPAGSLYDVIRGTKEICNHFGECFNRSSVVQFIGDYSSGATQQLQTIIRELPAIHMSYGASSVTLSDREDYPYFLRTNPADDLQAHFMVELLKALNIRSSESEINAVNIIYTEGLYGRTGAERVKKSLDRAGICVYLNRRVNLTASDNDFGALVEDIIYKTKNVMITIAFLGPEHIIHLMKTINTDSYQRAWQNTGLSFIFSDTWNDNPALLADYGKFMAGSFSFKFNSNFHSASFESYLRNVSISDKNYWLSTLVQEVGKCKIRGNFHSTYQKKCSSTNADLTLLNGESYSSHLMKAITSTVYGIRSIVLDNSEATLFDANTIKERYEMMLSIRIPRALESKLRNSKPFSAEGNGNVGYSIYNIKLDEHAQPVYSLVQTTGSGYYEKLQDFFKVPQFYTKSTPSADIKSTIPKCVIPPPGGATPSSPDNQSHEGPNRLTPPLIAVSVLFGVLVIVMLVVILVTISWYRRQTKKNVEDNMTEVSRKDGTYDEISYSRYMSDTQRDRILKFVAKDTKAATGSYTLASGYYTNNEEPDYQVPQNNRPILEVSSVDNLDNPVFSGSEASGPVRSTDDSFVSTAVSTTVSTAVSTAISTTKSSVVETSGTLTKTKTCAPVPVARVITDRDISSTPADNTSAVGNIPICVASHAEYEEHML